MQSHHLNTFDLEYHVYPLHFPLPCSWPYPPGPSVCEDSISSSFISLSFTTPTPWCETPRFSVRMSSYHTYGRLWGKFTTQPYVCHTCGKCVVMCVFFLSTNHDGILFFGQKKWENPSFLIRNVCNLTMKMINLWYLSEKVLVFVGKKCVVSKKDRDERSRGVEILISDTFVKIKPSEPFRLPKQSGRRNRDWSDSFGNQNRCLTVSMSEKQGNEVIIQTDWSVHF